MKLTENSRARPGAGPRVVAAQCAGSRLGKQEP